MIFVLYLVPNPNMIVVKFLCASVYPGAAPPPPSTKDTKMPLIIGLAITSATFFSLTLAILLSLVFCWRQKRIAHAVDEESNKDREMEYAFRNGAGPKGFDYATLAAATGNFSDYQKLGEGGLGPVYRGFLDELYVAIKRVSRQGRREYEAEVTIINCLRHRNLVKLIRWCHEHDELLLVYELMPNRSLDKHLYKEENILSWQCRSPHYLQHKLDLLHCPTHRNSK